MRFNLRTIASGIQFPGIASLNVLEQVVLQTIVEAVIADLKVKEQRVRKFPAMLTLRCVLGWPACMNMAQEQARSLPSRPLWVLPVLIAFGNACTCTELCRSARCGEGHKHAWHLARYYHRRVDLKFLKGQSEPHH